ncbi:endonuclease G [Bradyrhizobium shewense]|uniref:Endonuclease G n=1 Tax=Bradyrhizobium shewense TaxID=1761772 RepID=A0A1C3XUR9_9BRAD|nr:DNA/RNA non-specific endonuclease [Bradyrhizobium shewense]SCB55766.1 endonuclease G [Bradyrhizobium shewense]
MADKLDHSAFLRHLARGQDLTGLINDRMLEREEGVRAATADTESAAMPPDVRGAFEAAARGEPLSPAQQFATEAIILPELRPAIDVINDSYGQVTHPLWTKLSNNAGIKARLETAIKSVGRIELPNGPLPYAGTGFVVGQRQIMTNRHVAEIFTRGLGDRSLVFKPGLNAGFDLKRERGGGQGVMLTATRVLMIHPFWDCAVIEVDGLPATAQPLTLSAIPAPELRDREVAVIGYPAFDPRNPAAVQDDLFGGVFRVKRLQPGLLSSVSDTASFGKMVPAVVHDASTLGGNSGSCLVELTTGQVLGLHFGGAYRDRNYAVPASALGADPRVRAFGLKFDGPPPTTDPAWASWWQRAEESEAIVPDRLAPAPQAKPKPATVAVSDNQGGQGGAVVSTAADGSVNLTIPLHVTVRLGGAPPIAAETVSTEAATTEITEKMVMPFRDEDFSHRPGYDETFLKQDGDRDPIVVPMPTVKDDSVVAKTKQGKDRLDYQNFSIKIHAERRLALFTASNVTAESALKRPDKRKKYTRAALSGLGENDQEQWFLDPRLDDELQIADYFYTRDDGAFDKGHIVRRDDVAWGETYDDLRRANGDTYHVTNCSPQVAPFNRSAMGVDNWGDFENTVLTQAASERLCVFAGPVLDPDDDTFLGRDAPRSRIRVKIPSRFWKVVVARVEDGLAAFAVMLEQNLSKMPKAPPEGEEFVMPDEFLKSVVPLKDIEDWTGLTFATELHQVDQYDTIRGGEAAARSGARRGRVRKR